MLFIRLLIFIRSMTYAQLVWKYHIEYDIDIEYHIEYVILL